MSLEQAILEKKTELHALPFYQKMVAGELSDILYLKYLREIKYIHDYIDHKSDYKDFMDLRREMALHVDILELVHDLYPAEIEILGIGEDYAIMNMFQSLEQANAHGYVHYLEYLENADILKQAVPGKGRLYSFENVQTCIGYLQNNKPADNLTAECIKAYEVRISILKELGKLL